MWSCFQSVQEECDRLQDQLEDEKKRAHQFEQDVASTVAELTDLKASMTEMKDEKEKLNKLLEAAGTEKKVEIGCEKVVV